jgi:class 3 adenylate cyclase
MIAALLFLALAALVGVLYYANVLYKRIATARIEHKRVLSLFTRYMPAPVVEDLLARKDPRLFEAREYRATILCVRIRNFALFAEELTPAETLRYLNEFYTIVGQAVQRHKGFIESLRGDSVNAVFGVLVEEQFQEERALRAGLDIMRMIHAMNARWKSQGRRAFHVGMGVNSGKIVAGDTGYKDRREFAVIGNPAQVAARLEAASEELNASIIASEATYDPVRDLFIGIPTSSLPLKGLRQLQHAYIIRGLTRRTLEDDNLTLPSQQTFTPTVVRQYETPEPPPIEADAYAAAETPEPAPKIDAITREPEPEYARFSVVDDDAPALPEPPPLIGTYEDDQGPPIQLPP